MNYLSQIRFEMDIYFIWPAKESCICLIIKLIKDFHGMFLLKKKKGLKGFIDSWALQRHKDQEN